MKTTTARPYDEAKRRWAYMAAYAVSFAIIATFSKHVIPWHMLFS
jgi:hypothetical protein